MTEEFRLFPESAASSAGELDLLFFTLLGVSAFFCLVIFGLILVFVVRYRRRPGRDSGEPIHANVALEAAWVLFPLGIALGLFGWGAKIYVESSRVPAEATEVYGVGRQWMWQFHHPGGPREINELHLPTGRPVQVTLTSEDVIHSFFVPAFRRKIDVLPERYTRIWFEPDKVGEYHLFCAEYCGTKHSEMIGRVVVQEPDAFAAWIEAQSQRETTLQAGERLFAFYGCKACHEDAAGDKAPRLAGLGALDDDALRRAILSPGELVLPGYSTAMPTYRGQISEVEVLQLIDYLRSRSAP